MSNQKVKPTLVKIPARASYANVFEPKGINGSEPKYSCSILIDKEDEKTLNQIEKAIQAALEEGKAKFGGKIPKNFKSPLRDGDDDRPGDEAYEGCMFINANNKNKPTIITKSNERIEDDPQEFYSGCYGKFMVNFYAYNTNGNKGVAASLGNILKTDDGERLSGGFSNAEDDFASDLEEDDLG